MRRWVALLAVAAGVLMVRPGTAEASAPLACGSHITRSVTLRYDLNCPGQLGLIVDRGHVTVDLHGHTITGDTTMPGSFGVGVRYTAKGVTIKNGTIREFAGGVAGFGPGTRVSHIVSIGADNIGIEVHDGGSVSDSFVRDALEGGILARGTRAVLRDNVVSESGLGLVVNGSSSAIENRAINNNDVGLAIGGGGRAEENLLAQNAAGGIEIFPAAVEHNVVTRNRVLANGLDGINLEIGAVNNVVSRNDIRANRNGIFIDANANGNVIDRNSVLYNTNTGILASAKTVITKNRVTGNVVNGIELDAGADQSVVSGNTSSANGNSGIVGNASAEIVENVANENASSGIVLSANGTLDRNTADFNGFLNGSPGNALGISDLAGAPSTPHGNFASGNAATSGQCDPSSLCTSPSVRRATTFLHCGDSISSNTILGNNLSCTSGTGIEIVNPDVTLDLNGHRVDNTTDTNPSGGVYVHAARGSIRNGEIGRFGVGVEGDAAMTVTDTVLGAIGEGFLSGAGGRASHNLIVGAGIGVQVGGHGTVDNNVIVGPCDTGMWLQNAAAYRVTNNLVWGCTSPGIDLEGGAVSGRASVVSGNTIGGCRFGVDLVAIGRPAVIRSNRFYANDYGFYDSASAASDITRNGFWNNVTAITGLVSGDRITKNKLYASSNGIVLSATHVVVSHNAISGSGNSGLVLNDAAIGDRILSNVIFSGAAAGLVESHGGNTVKSNRIFENAHDGMYVQTSSGSLRNNLLVSNGWLNGVPSGTSDFGIEVAAGVTPPPSHHNRAHRNASGTPQCLPATVCS